MPVEGQTGVSVFFDGLKVALKEELVAKLDLVEEELRENLEIVDDFREIREHQELTNLMLPFQGSQSDQLKGQKGDYPLAALLAEEWPEAAAYARLKSLVILTAFLLQSRDDFSPTIGSACNAVRLLIENREAAGSLPVLSSDLGSAHRQIKQLVNDHQKFNRLERERLISCRVLLQKFVNSKEPTKRKSAEKAIEFRPALGSEAMPIRARQVYDPPAKPHKGSGEKEMEASAERPNSELVIQYDRLDPKNVASRSSDIMKTVNKKTSQKIVMNQMRLPSSWNTMSLDEARKLVEHFRSGRATRLVGFLVVISLLTGRSIPRLFNLPTKQGAAEYWHKHNEIWCIAYRPKIARQKIDRKQILDDRNLDLLENSFSQPLLLPLPSEVQEIAELFVGQRGEKSEEETLKEIQVSLSKLSKNANRSFTFGRITTFLDAFLTNQGRDNVVRAWLTGAEPQQESGLHYTQLDSAKLLEVYRGVLTLFDLSLPQDLFAKNIVGSALMPKQKILSSLISKLRREVGSCNKPLRYLDWRALHAAFTYYMYQLVSIAVAGRPVLEPYGRLDDFDLDGKFMIIHDKEEQSFATPRLIPLPHTIVEQLRQYIEYLKLMKIRVSVFSQRASKSIGDALSADGPFFFFLGLDGEALALDPARLENFRENQWPLPLNWQRHFIRTHFTMKCVGELIEGQMGHGQFGKSYMGPFSGRSPSELREIADQMERCLEGLGAEVIPCPVK